MYVDQFSLQDWQIFQRSNQEEADIELHGQLKNEADDSQHFGIRICREESGASVANQLEHVPITCDQQRVWHQILPQVPSGGPYRLELSAPGYYSCLHHLGVGDIWLIAGQSNAAGYSGGIIDDPAMIGVHQFCADQRWKIATHPLGDGWGHSPLLAFGKSLKQALGVPIGLVPLAIGGSSLANWNPGEGEAPLYHRLIKTVKAIGGHVKGMIWYQGCTDAENEQTASSYACRFQQFIQRLRADIKQSDLPVITTQLNRLRANSDPKQDQNWSILREQQLICTQIIPRVAVVPTLDLNLSDAIHNSAASNLVLAERYKQTALGFVYHHGTNWQAPLIRKATFCSERTQVTVEFDHVPIGMVIAAEDIEDFDVFDIEGKITYTVADRYLYNTNKVVLKLHRPIGINPFIRLSYGRNPISTIRRYRDQMPPLACLAMTIKGE